MRRYQLMLCGAGLGFLIYLGVAEISDAWYHHGPGYVTYGGDIPDSEGGGYVEEFSVKRPEAVYKRHHYAMGVMLAGLGVFMWVLVARGEPKSPLDPD